MSASQHYSNESFEFHAAPGVQGAALFEQLQTSKKVEEVIEPKWWTGTPPLAASEFVIDCKGRKPVLDSAFQELARGIFEKHGVLLIINTGMTDLEEMRPFMYGTIMKQPQRYDGGSNNRPQLDPYFLEVGAPDSAWLHYHHEMCYIGKSTKALGFACKAALGGVRGATFIADNTAATDKLLATPFGQKLKEKGVCYIRALTDAAAYEGQDSSTVFNHWQMSMGTDDPRKAESKARSMGLKVDWGTDALGKPRCMYTRYYTTAFEYFPQMDRNLLYTSIANDNLWFDTWPGVAALPADARPLQMRFGDDTPFSREEMQQFIDLFDNFGMPIEWAVGDIGIICNYRWVHGRPAFVKGPGEGRTLGVVIGEIYERVETREDKW